LKRSIRECRKKSPERPAVGACSSAVAGHATSRAMTTIRLCVLVLIAFAVTNCSGADQEYYRTFLSMVDTNSTRIVSINSPLLIDTNNNALKLANFAINLADTKAKGQLYDIHLGMTMEQVVARWGKPRCLWSRCYGGPRFCYAGGVSVIFEPGSNSVKNILWLRYDPPDLPLFSDGLDASTSSIEEFIRVLGIPSARNLSKDTAWSELVYITSAGTLRLHFSGGRLTSLGLDVPSKVGKDRK
jgi:hypothetical protein